MQVDYEKLTPEEIEDGVVIELAGSAEPNTEYTFTLTPGSDFAVIADGEVGEIGQPVEYVVTSDEEGYLPVIEFAVVDPVGQEDGAYIYVYIEPAPQTVVTGATSSIYLATPLESTMPWTEYTQEYASVTDHIIGIDEEATFTFTPPENIRLLVSGGSGADYGEPGETITHTAKSNRGEFNFTLVASEDGVTELAYIHIDVQSGG